jgi:hypothetical protein
VTVSGVFGSLLGLGLVAAAVGAATHGAGPRMALGAYRELCARWGAVWGVPAVVLEVVGIIESSMHPKLIENEDPRAVGRGGAWGLFQMTLATADGLMQHPALKARPEARKWDGTGASLLDPELNAMLASYYLAALWRQFGTFLPTVTAYQQGPKTVAHVLANGGNLVADLPPKGREYAARAIAVLAELQSSGRAAA